MDTVGALARRLGAVSEATAARPGWDAVQGEASYPRGARIYHARRVIEQAWKRVAQRVNFEQSRGAKILTMAVLCPGALGSYDRIISQGLPGPSARLHARWALRAQRRTSVVMIRQDAGASWISRTMRTRSLGVVPSGSFCICAIARSRASGIRARSAFARARRRSAAS